MSDDQELNLFRAMAERVPAYAAFLKEHGVESSKLNSPAAVAQIPYMTKKNYLQRHALAELCYTDRLGESVEYCATSGSTSEPVYFPRTDQLAEQYADIIERFMAAGSSGPRARTLVIVGFGMGVWIGGVITVRALEIAAQRSKLSLAILPTGINRAEIMRGLTKLAPGYDQTVLIGYPPFVKDMLDDAVNAQIDLSRLNLRLMFAAESFNEQFRDYVVSKGAVANPCTDTLNIYGSAEAGAMAAETPVSILVRRLATTRPALFHDLFGQITNTPTLAQYDPRYITFSAEAGELALSCDAILPLVRYRVGDRGGVLDYRTVESTLKQHGLNLAHEIQAAGVRQVPQEHPFVFVYERSDFAVSLYGATLFPEMVKDGLVDSFVSSWLTERFTMVVRYSESQQQYLEVNLECRLGKSPDAKIKQRLANALKAAMSARSSEFREICQQLTAAKVVKFVYWPFEDPTYFKPGVKQRWSVRDTPSNQAGPDKVQ